MKGIKKADFLKIQELHSGLAENIALHNYHLKNLEAVVNASISNYMREHGSEVHSNIDSINEIQETISSLAQKQVMVIDDYIKERSDSWHESKAADNMSDFYEDWHAYANDVKQDLDGYPFLSIKFELTEMTNLPSKDRK
jgi:hypothetical protein